MTLNAEQKAVCKVFRRRDKTGHVHCMDCPMRLSNRFAVCLKTLSREDATKNWDWNGSLYPALESEETT